MEALKFWLGMVVMFAGMCAAIEVAVFIVYNLQQLAVAAIFFGLLWLEIKAIERFWPERWRVLR